MKVNSPYAWFLASRPKTLSAALMPVAVAIAFAYTDGHTLNLIVALLLVAFAALMQVAANFINDLFDFLKGTDDEERLGPERACAQGWVTPFAMKVGIGIVLCFAGACGLALLWLCRAELVDPHLLIFLGVICFVFAFLYTTMLSYCGMGDVLVWVFFGFVPVCGTYYVLTSMIPTHIVWISLAIGLATDNLLVLNNYRDREQDKAHGKRTLVVLLGRERAELFYLIQGFLAYLVLCYVLAMRTSGTLGIVICQILSLAYLILHYFTWRKMVKIRQGRALNKILAQTSFCILSFGILTIISLFVAK